MRSWSCLTSLRYRAPLAKFRLSFLDVRSTEGLSLHDFLDGIVPEVLEVFGIPGILGIFSEADVQRGLIGDGAEACPGDATF